VGTPSVIKQLIAECRYSILGMCHGLTVWRWNSLVWNCLYKCMTNSDWMVLSCLRTRECSLFHFFVSHHLTCKWGSITSINTSIVRFLIQNLIGRCYVFVDCLKTDAIVQMSYVLFSDFNFIKHENDAKNEEAITYDIRPQLFYYD